MSKIRHIVYKLTNKINGKIYIGKTSRTLRKRLLYHTYQSRKHTGSHICNAIRLYGVSGFHAEILEICSSDDQANEKEKYWIAQFSSTDPELGYNLTPGGTGGATYHGPRSPEVCEKIRQGKLEYTFTEEHKQNMRKAAKHRAPRSAEATAKAIQTKRKNGTLGFSAEAHEKARQAKLGQTWNVGKVWLFNPNTCKSTMVGADHIDEYLSKGWIRKCVKNKKSVK